MTRAEVMRKLKSLARAENDLSDAFFTRHLDTIRKTIHTRKNQVRYSMNNVLIAIGGRKKKRC